MSTNSVYYVGGQDSSTAENFTSWLDSLNPATFPYELIILLYVLVYGMQSQTVTVTDVADESDAAAQCQTDASTMISELTTLQSAAEDSSSGNFNTGEFTVADLNTFCNAFYDLFVSDSANPPESDLGINVNGTTYYPAVDSSTGSAYWTTTPPDSDQSASDLQMYMYYTAIYECDMDYFNGGMSSVESQESTIFWGEGDGSESGDAGLQSLKALWNWFDSTPFGGTETFSEAIQEYVESGGEKNDTTWTDIENNNWEMFAYIDDLAADQYQSTQDGETSILDTGISDMQSVQNTFSDESQQDANLIEQATEEIQSLSKLCQNATQQSNQAILNSINSYRVA